MDSVTGCDREGDAELYHLPEDSQGFKSEAAAINVQHGEEPTIVEFLARDHRNICWHELVIEPIAEDFFLPSGTLLPAFYPRVLARAAHSPCQIYRCSDPGKSRK